MAATRPWWHEMVAGLSTERAPAPRSGAGPRRSTGPVGISTQRNVGYGGGASPPLRSPGGFIRRKVSEWDPGSAAVAWVRRATHDGRAIAIRRAQDALGGRAPQTLGITPIVSSAPRTSTARARALLLVPPPHQGPAEPPGERALARSNPIGAPRARVSRWRGGGRPQPPLDARPQCTLVVHHASRESLGATTRDVVAPLAAPAPTAPPSHDNPSPSAPVAAAPAACIPPRLPTEAVTLCGAHAHPPTLGALPPGSGVQAATTRRTGVSTAPPVPCRMPCTEGAPRPALRGKGAKHARLCAGPWASALALMPPIPLTGAKRSRAGLAHVPISSDDISRTRRERAACALASILPWAAAGFVLGDSDAMVASRPASETTSRLVRALSAYGASSTDAAHSALGRLVSWMVTHHPGAPTIEGSHVSDFLEHTPPSAATLAGLTWLRDHCGLALPARGPVCRPHRGRPPAAPRSKESLSVGIVVSLEHIATHHPSGLVRGQAAGWSTLARLALRVEQAQSCVVSAFTRHEFAGEVFTIVVGAVQRDKHPDPSKRRPRPVWGVIDGLDEPTCLRSALEAMLAGVEGSHYLIRDTDSPDGDPTRATKWVSAPLRGANRVDASLQALLRLPPASLFPEEAGRYHGHSAKRFLLNVAEASGAFTPVEACEVGRFSLSTAQSPDLEPVAAMLRAHSMRASVLPDIYAGKAKVARVFDLLARAHLVLRAARRALAADPSLTAVGDASWGASGPFASARPPTQQLLALTCPK